MWNQTLRKCGFTGISIDLPDYEDPFKTMNVLVSSVDGFTKSEVANADADAENGLIERFYPMNPPTGLHADTGTDASSVVLIDCIEKPFFAELTTWLVETGIRCIVVAKSTPTQDNEFDESILLHLENLRRLGVSVSMIWEPLSTTNESKFSMQLRATLSPGVKAVLFGRGGVDMEMEGLHLAAQRIFSKDWNPEKMIILTSVDESIFNEPTEKSTLARRVADSWAARGTLAGLLSMFQREPDFDELVPSLEFLFSRTKASAFDSAPIEAPRAKLITYGLTPAITSSLLGETDTDVSSQTREKFSVILQTAAAQATSNGAKIANGEAVTPVAAAIARFSSIPAEDADSRRGAATDAVAEVLAELLFIPKEQINIQANLTAMGIDSLIASELRTQIGKLFGKDVSTGWVLSGEVKAEDIVEVVLE